jgi:hypothetical protein
MLTANITRTRHDLKQVVSASREDAKEHHGDVPQEIELPEELTSGIAMPYPEPITVCKG